MTKQEEIREEISKSLAEVFWDGWNQWYETGKDYPFLEKADAILQYLDSEGAVIKVVRELPEIYTRDEDSLDPEDYQFLKGMRFILNAGYVATMPLIDKEVKHDRKRFRLATTKAGGER